MTAPASVYRLLAADYDRQPNPILALARRTLPGLFPNLEGKRILDVAAGTGYWADWCTRRGAVSIAVDVCPEMLAYAPKPSVLAEGERLPFADGVADVVVCAFGLSYIRNGFPELVRVTRIGGALLVADLHPEALDRGWTRSFRHNGEVIIPGTVPYRIADLGGSGMALHSILAPHFGSAEQAIFDEAGKGEAFAQASAHPAIFAARWDKV